MELLNEDYNKNAIQFLKQPEIQDAINNYDFVFIYRELYENIEPEITSGVTSIFFKAGIDPLKYLKNIPACYLYGDFTIKSFKIPDHVKSIGIAAFCCCENLRAIQIPSNIKEIETHAFGECYGLTSITIEEGLTHIGYEAFIACTSLRKIKLPNSVTYIEAQVFNNCSPDLIVEVPKHLQSMCESINLGIPATQLRYY